MTTAKQGKHAAPYVPGELRVLHPEPCQSRNGPCICLVVEDAIDAARADTLDKAIAAVAALPHNSITTWDDAIAALEALR